MGRRQKDAGNAGFTLLELMVALVLTSLLCLVAYSALSLTLKGVRRSQAAAERLQELRIGQNLLERSLSSTVTGTLDTKPYFVGSPKEVRFFTLLPLEAHDLGGVYHWRALLGQDEGGQGVLAVEQTRSLNWRRDPEGVEVRQIIMGNVAGLRFVYGLDNKEFESWDGKSVGRLPEWVRLEFTLRGLEPQALVIPIHVVQSKSGSPGAMPPRGRGGFPGGSFPGGLGAQE
jgi:prepilin-type N-terminal cleavage/methylation domain-containing protein